MAAIYPNPRKNGIDDRRKEKQKPADNGAGGRAAAALAAIEASVKAMKRDASVKPSPFSVGGRPAEDAIDSGVPSDFATTLRQHYGANHASPMSPEQEKLLLAAGQRVDPAGPFRSTADRSADPRMENLRAASVADQAAKEKSGREFVDFLRRAPQTTESSYAAINQRRSDAGLSPVSVPSDTEIQNSAMTRKDRLLEAGQAMRDKGLAMRAQNEKAAQSYNEQRAAQGAAKRLGGTAQGQLLIRRMIGDPQRPAAPQAVTMADSSPLPMPASNPAAANFLDRPEAALLVPELVQQRMRGQVDTAKQQSADAANSRQLAINAVQAGATEAAKQLDERINSLPLGSPDRAALEQQKQKLTASMILKLMEMSGVSPGSAPEIASALGGASPSASAGTPEIAVSAGSQQPGQQLEIANFPAATSDAQIASGAANFQPNFPALRSASPFAEKDLADVFANSYRPKVPWQDANQDGIPQPNEVSDGAQLQYELGKIHARRALDQVLNDQGIDWRNPITAYQTGMSKFGNSLGPDVVRWAIAEKFNQPQFIRSYDEFARGVTQPSDKPALPWTSMMSY